ncbi:hypothetical protein B484DRAFT_448922 [Ochromonadaceae sp. CCMP2298]|nr:hypothetical protein B484DRAFT_448922 [Ochromonadaceae sp. CCMP2298]
MSAERLREEGRLRVEARLRAERNCFICGVVSTNKCSKCKATYYCGREHQQADWECHKDICKRHRAINKAYVDLDVALQRDYNVTISTYVCRETLDNSPYDSMGDMMALPVPAARRFMMENLALGVELIHMDTERAFAEALRLLSGCMVLDRRDRLNVRHKYAILLTMFPRKAKYAFQFISHWNTVDHTNPQTAGSLFWDAAALTGDGLWGPLDPSLIPHIGLTGRSVAPALEFLGSLVLIKHMTMEATEAALVFQVFMMGTHQSAGRLSGVKVLAAHTPALQLIRSFVGIGNSAVAPWQRLDKSNSSIADLVAMRDDLQVQFEALVAATESVPEYRGFWPAVYNPSYMQGMLGPADHLRAVNVCRQMGVVLRVSNMWMRYEDARAMLASVLGGGVADIQSAARMMQSAQTGPLGRFHG